MHFKVRIGGFAVVVDSGEAEEMRESEFELEKAK